jgi:hypothetical protein
VESRLSRIRLAVLKDVGPGVPHDLGVISRQGAEGGKKGGDKK